MGYGTGRVLTALIAGLSAYLLLCLLAFVFQRNLMFFPVRWSAEESRSANPGYEDVELLASDGPILHGWLHRRPDAPWTVVIFHGNAGNLRYHEEAMAPFRALGLQVLLFDYRGYGRSTGTPGEGGLVRDGEAAADFVALKLRVPPEKIVYFGQSLGAGVAVLVAAGRPPGRLILESAYDSLVAVARRHYFYLPVGLLMRDRFEADRVIGGIHCPVLFLHPAEDEIIPVAAGRALFARANEPREFVLLPRAHHNDSLVVAMPEHLEAIGRFLGVRPIPGPAAPAPEAGGN